MDALRARVQHERERERALLERLRLARKARMEELRLDRYHLSPEYKRWLKSKEELKRAAPFQRARWRMHDGAFHDLEGLPVLRSTRLAVAADGSKSGSKPGSRPDADGYKEIEAAVDVEGERGDEATAEDGSGGDSRAPARVASQERQHDSYLRRGGATFTPSSDMAKREGPQEHLLAKVSGAPTPTHAKRWAALLSPTKQPQRPAADVSARFPVSVSGGGSKAVGLRLGGDRWGVGVIPRSTGAPRSTGIPPGSGPQQ